MNKISALEIRDKFLKYFQENDHLLISDSSIIPKNDPTLLFINSGMAPIKRLFTGEEIPPSPRLCNVQPCIRTIDIDEVGDKHHLTSFQMLGSWSIGDYFKKEAIHLAFNFLTKYLNIPKEKLYVTIFSGDEELGLDLDLESKKYWLEVGVDESHIVACGKEDNFWGPTSETGPCGPCTEVFFDTGTGEENKYIPGGEFDTKSRYIEIWNAGVFMQLNKNADGTYSKLKFKSVDTGAGLERLAMALNGYESVYETDLLAPIKDFIKGQLKENEKIPPKDILIMTDHLRTTALILSELVKPSNEGRGYIPRKLIRKCVRLALKAKVNDFNFSKVLEFILDRYLNIFANFSLNKDFILNEFEKECTQFHKVLVCGIEKLELLKEKTNKISDHFAFDMVTTYGLPFDILLEFAKEANMEVDESGFNLLIQKHKDISRNSTEVGATMSERNLEILNTCDKTKFKGYETLKTSAKVKYILKENDFVLSASSGQQISLITDETSFYAESGGQCADEGYIFNNNFKMKVTDVQKKNNGVFLHIGVIESGFINEGDSVEMAVDKNTRENLANNHSAAHLLHSALKEVFGKEVNQAGSKVEKDRLRFDFNCDKKITDEDIYKIEKIVNSNIRKNIECSVECKDLQSAIEEGAVALFENKYADEVRVIKFGDFSKELCGGTHTSMTGNIGLFVILSTEGIGKGIKRITAITGEKAIEHIIDQRALIKEISSVLKVKPEGVLAKVSRLNQKEGNFKNSACKKEFSFDNITVEKTKNGLNFAIIQHEEFDKNLRDAIIDFSDKINGVVLYVAGNKPSQALVAVAEGQVNSYNAGGILKGMLSKIGGKGGGNARNASGGGIECEFEMIKSSFLENI